MASIYAIALPALLAILLLILRNKYHPLVYMVTLVPVFLLAIIYCALYPSYYYYWRAPLLAGGFHSWAMPVIVVSIGMICAHPAKSTWPRILQWLACMLVTGFWLEFAGWIA